MVETVEQSEKQPETQPEQPAQKTQLAQTLTIKDQPDVKQVSNADADRQLLKNVWLLNVFPDIFTKYFNFAYKSLFKTIWMSLVLYAVYSVYQLVWTESSTQVRIERSIAD